jgi:protein involved in polysaccharide export with SLBB domain
MGNPKSLLLLGAACCLARLVIGSASAQQLPAAAPLAKPGYVLGADDQILIRVLEGLDLGEKPVLIGTNGYITLPLVGRLEVAGLTVDSSKRSLSRD